MINTAAALLLTTVASSAPAQCAQQVAHEIVAFAAPPAVEIEFERNGVTHGHGRRVDRRLSEQRPTEIGVQDRARQVQHGLESGRLRRFEPCERGVSRVQCAERRARLLARGGNRGADCLDRRRMAEAFDQRHAGRSAQDCIHGRQIACARRLCIGAGCSTVFAGRSSDVAPFAGREIAVESDRRRSAVAHRAGGAVRQTPDARCRPRRCPGLAFALRRRRGSGRVASSGTSSRTRSEFGTRPVKAKTAAVARSDSVPAATFFTRT